MSAAKVTNHKIWSGCQTRKSMKGNEKLVTPGELWLNLSALLMVHLYSLLIKIYL